MRLGKTCNRYNINYQKTILYRPIYIGLSRIERVINQLIISKFSFELCVLRKLVCLHIYYRAYTSGIMVNSFADEHRYRL